MAYRIKNIHSKSSGYIAIISCIAMGMLLLSIVATQSISALFARMDALSFEYAIIRKEHTRACAQIATLHLIHSLQTYPTSVYIGGETIISAPFVCTVNSVVYETSKHIAHITVSAFYDKATTTHLFSINTKFLIQ